MKPLKTKNSIPSPISENKNIKEGYKETYACNIRIATLLCLMIQTSIDKTIINFKRGKLE